MATALSSTISSVARAQFSSAGFSGSPIQDFERGFSGSECTKLYFATYTVGTSPTSIDLTSLTDAFGNALSFATIRHLAIINNDVTNNLTVGGGSNGLFAALPFTLTGSTASSGNKGSCLQLTANITVDGTHKILTLTSSASTISVNVFILGV